MTWSDDDNRKLLLEFVEWSDKNQAVVRHLPLKERIDHFLTQRRSPNLNKGFYGDPRDTA